MGQFVDLVRKINNASIQSASQSRQRKLIKIPTTIFELDIIIGGGIPEGRATLIWGDKSSGKTTLCYIISNSYLQKYKDKTVLFVDFEGTHDQKWADRFIDLKNSERFHVFEPDYGEQGIDILIELASAEDLGLLIVDSLAQIVPTKDADSKAGEGGYPLGAKLVTKMFMQLQPIVSISKHEGRNLTCIFTNQLVFNVDKNNPYAPKYIKPRGKKQEFIASIELQLKDTRYIYDKKNNISLQAKHSFILLKTKAGGIHKGVGDYSINLLPLNGKKVGYIDDLNKVIKASMEIGVIEKKGNKWLVGKEVYETRSQVIKALEENDKLFEEIKIKTIDSLINNPIIKNIETVEE